VQLQLAVRHLAAAVVGADETLQAPDDGGLRVGGDGRAG
jgi:hypothetical protein